MNPVEIARNYLGKTEKPGNAGFNDPEFEKDMIKYGEWQPGYAWCACFAQMVFRKCFPEISDALKKLFDPSTRKTMLNFQEAGYTTFTEPFVGALVIWGQYSKGKLLWNGHAGIVSQVFSKTDFAAVEGNTAKSGSRNGDRVYEHTTRNTKKKKDGLVVLAFFKIA